MSYGNLIQKCAVQHPYSIPSHVHISIKFLAGSAFVKATSPLLYTKSYLPTYSPIKNVALINIPI